MLQKELAKRLKARYDTQMDGNEWMEVSSDGIPLCRIKTNGQFLSNADQNLSDEYRSKTAGVQAEISAVREYVGLYEHAPQMKADGVSDHRQLAAFGDIVLAASYSEKTVFCSAHGNRTRTAVRCFGEIILRTMNMSKKPSPCAPILSAGTACSVRTDRHNVIFRPFLGGLVLCALLGRALWLHCFSLRPSALSPILSEKRKNNGSLDSTGQAPLCSRAILAKSPKTENASIA